MDDTATAPAIRGLDLRLLRTERRVTASAVAAAAGWSRQRVSTIEATDRPTPSATRRYLAALTAAAGR